MISLSTNLYKPVASASVVSATMLKAERFRTAAMLLWYILQIYFVLLLAFITPFLETKLSDLLSLPPHKFFRLECYSLFWGLKKLGVSYIGPV